MTKRQAEAERALGYHANFYHIPIRSNENYFGLVSHTSKHVGERLRAEGHDLSRPIQGR